MYKRILVPTDGSERSVKAVEGAARFAKPLGATLVIMTVIEPYSYTNLAEYRPESIEQYMTSAYLLRQRSDSLRPSAWRTQWAWKTKP